MLKYVSTHCYGQIHSNNKLLILFNIIFKINKSNYNLFKNY